MYRNLMYTGTARQPEVAKLVPKLLWEKQEFQHNPKVANPHRDS
ncbi:MAG TPA: hypothetical protein VIM94_04470 [Salegentibacter sp.]